MRTGEWKRFAMWQKILNTAGPWALLFGACCVSAEESGQAEVDVDYALSVLQERSERAPARFVAFREERVFPFRDKPVSLEGEIRIDRELGASIYYPEKRAAVIVDGEGLLLRRFDGEGRFRQRALNRRQADEGADLLALLLSFDRQALEERFRMETEGGPDDWTLYLYPKNGSKEDLERVVLESDGQGLRRIGIELSGGRAFRILPQEEEEGEAFSQEERERYFR